MSYGSQFRSPLLFQGALKSGAKDPRALVRNVRGYDPARQADQAQFRALSDQVDYGVAPLSDAVKQSAQTFASSSRIQVNYTSFPYIGNIPSAQQGGVLVLPRNNNRSNFYMINLSGSLVYLTFDAISNPLVYGIPIPNNDKFSETNGVVGVNDIYINGGNAPVAGGVILAYEGVPILTSPGSSS